MDSAPAAAAAAATARSTTIVIATETKRATATPGRIKTEDIRATATGVDWTPFGSKPLGRERSPSTASTNTTGLESPTWGWSVHGEGSTGRSTHRLPTSRRVVSEDEGNAASSMRISRTGSSRRLFCEGSTGGGSFARASGCISVGSLENSGSMSQNPLETAAVIKAAGEGDASAVLQFLNSGGDVNAKNKTGASTLMCRAAAKGRLNIVKLLLEHGAAVNVPGRGGLTPLHEASGCGQVEVCRMLLGAGATVAARDHSKRCPLHYAGTSLDVTKVLLSFGADPDAQDKNGQRPDAMAINQEARALLRDARCAIGDNASRVIASLRCELENLRRETQAAKESAEKDAARSEELKLELHSVRNVRERDDGAERARIWEGLAAAIKAEMDEVKVHNTQLSVENLELRREVSEWERHGNEWERQMQEWERQRQESERQRQESEQQRQMQKLKASADRRASRKTHNFRQKQEREHQRQEWERQGQEWERQGQEWERERQEWERQRQEWERQGQEWKRQGQEWERQGQEWERQGQEWERERQRHRHEELKQGIISLRTCRNTVDPRRGVLARIFGFIPRVEHLQWDT